MALAKQSSTSSAAKRWFTWLTAVGLLLQVVGIQQLCFCGACEVSKVLAQWVPLASGPGHDEAGDEHPCCAAARREAEREQAKLPAWSSEGDCGCDQEGHGAQAINATFEPSQGASVPSLALAMDLPARTLAPVSIASWSISANLARGPPLAQPADLYLTQRRLLL